MPLGEVAGAPKVVWYPLCLVEQVGGGWAMEWGREVDGAFVADGEGDGDDYVQGDIDEPEQT